MALLSRRLILLSAFGVASGASAKDKKKSGKAKSPQGLLSGTVFSPQGLSFAGAKVTVYDAEQKTAGKAVSDQRGEYAIRLAATPDGAKYRVVAEAEGFDRAEREVEIFEAQMTRANFRMKASE